jgi:hypothetical protein
MTAVGPLMAVLRSRFNNMEPSEIPVYISELTKFFIDGLELRTKWASNKKVGEKFFF